MVQCWRHAAAIQAGLLERAVLEVAAAAVTAAALAAWVAVAFMVAEQQAVGALPMAAEYMAVGPESEMNLETAATEAADFCMGSAAVVVLLTPDTVLQVAGR